MKTALITLLLLANVAVAQQASKPKVQFAMAKYTSPASGKEMFNSYCASCHGASAKGDGPAAIALKQGAPDLTVLAKTNGGVFPSMHVYELIKGDTAVSAHGSPTMPVWGPVLSRISMSSNSQTQQRLHNLTAYLESLQVK